MTFPLFLTHAPHALGMPPVVLNTPLAPETGHLSHIRCCHIRIKNKLGLT